MERRKQTRKRLHSESKRGRHCDGPVRTSSVESSRKAQLLKGAGVAAQKRLEGLDQWEGPKGTARSLEVLDKAGGRHCIGQSITLRAPQTPYQITWGSSATLRIGLYHRPGSHTLDLGCKQQWFSRLRRQFQIPIIWGTRSAQCLLPELKGHRVL